MITTIIFDAGGVLHESNTAVSDDLEKELGLTQTQLKQIWSGEIQRLGRGEMNEDKFWKEISDTYKVRKVSPQERLLARAFERTLKINHQMLDIAKQLNSAGYTTAVLSDTIAAHAEVLEAAGSYAPFGQLFLSHETGLRKPDPKIYKLVLKKLAVRPDEAVFIDDSAVNVETAKAIGMHGITFETPEQCFDELTKLLPDTELKLLPAA